LKLLSVINYKFNNEDTVRGASFDKHIPHFKLLKKLGVRFHRDCTRDCLEFRFATFSIVSNMKWTQKTHLKISIPFKRMDIAIVQYN